MKLRLHGTPEECREALERVSTVLHVVSTSDPFPDRGASVLVRVYLEARVPEDTIGGARGRGRSKRP